MPRLRDTLTAPLSDWDGLSDRQYAEWVSVRARVARLRAHAQCACIKGRGGDELAADVVARAQKPYL